MTANSKIEKNFNLLLLFTQ